MLLFETSLTGGNRGNGEGILGKEVQGRDSPPAPAKLSTDSSRIQIDSKVNSPFALLPSVQLFFRSRLNRWLQSFSFEAVIRFMEQLFARLKVSREQLPPPKLRDATLVITHAELSYRHGTGALLIRILQQEKNVIVFHSQSFFDRHDLAFPAFQITHSRSSGANSRRRIQR